MARFRGCVCGCVRGSIPRLCPSRYSLRAQPLKSSLGRVPQAPRLDLQQSFANRIVSVAEDCLSPERTFHGCSLMYRLKSGSCRFWQRTDLPPGSNMLRAEIQRALRRAPRQLRGLRLGLQTHRGSNHSSAHVGESNSRSNVF